MTKISVAHPGLWIAVAALAIAFFAVWYFASLRLRLTRPRSLAVALLRFVVLSVLLVLLAEPVVLRERRESFRPLVPVGIDTSMSMGLRGGREETRLERARDFVGSPAFTDAVSNYYTELFVFDETSRYVSPQDLDTMSAEGRWTDVGAAVAEVGGNGNAGAVVIVTDGSHSGESILETMERSQVPVVVMNVESGETLRDAEVARVEGSDIAFTGRPVELHVTVRAKGYGNKELPVVLKEGGKVVATRHLVFGNDREEKTLSYSWSPPATGRYHLTVEIPPQAGEEVAMNNAVHFPVEVRRDKIRILLVSGRPSWNYRFIREALKGDPTVDLISFIILRSASDVVNVPQDELSLIPFPTKKIFLEELKNFDLIIFENFSFRFYFPQQYLNNVKEFVRKGGGFWMLGGPLSFSRGGYSGTNLAEVLPVKLPGDMTGGYSEGIFRAVVTPGGTRHPLLRGLDSRDYGILPPLEGFNRTTGVAKKALVLLEHSEEGAPLLVIGRHGEGRVLALMTDSIWKWNFEMAGSGRGKTFFLSLIRQAVRWTIGDPLMEPVRLSLQQDSVMTGEKIKGSVRAYSEDFLPAKDPDISVVLRDESGEAATVPLEGVADGVYEFAVPAPAAGTYQIRAEVRADGEAYGSDSASLNVSWPAGELRMDGSLPVELPAKLAEMGHRIIEVADSDEAARDLAAALTEGSPPYRVLTEEKKGIGEEWWAFGIIFGLLAGEWLVRRRYGVE